VSREAHRAVADSRHGAAGHEGAHGHRHFEDICRARLNKYAAEDGRLTDKASAGLDPFKVTESCKGLMAGQETGNSPRFKP